MLLSVVLLSAVLLSAVLLRAVLLIAVLLSAVLLSTGTAQVPVPGAPGGPLRQHVLAAAGAPGRHRPARLHQGRGQEDLLRHALQARRERGQGGYSRYTLAPCVRPSIDDMLVGTVSTVPCIPTTQSL